MVAAGADNQSQQSQEALATLCQTYWYPLYCFARRWGCGPDEAADAVQGFFLEVLSKRNLFASADPERGRFRSYLRAAAQHYLSNERRRAGALKRGGDRAQLSLDLADGEARYARLEPSHELTPERLFERQWALTVLDEALAALAAEEEGKGAGELFATLRPYLAGQGTLSYRELGERLELSEGALKVRIHRLRKRCRELLLEAVADTVADETEREAELAYLSRLFGA